MGDVLWLLDDEIIPVDCIVLKTPQDDGSCMISTGQLDGERALKPKYATKQTQNELATLVKGDELYSIQCSEPNSDLFFFDGQEEIWDETAAKTHT